MLINGNELLLLIASDVIVVARARNCPKALGEKENVRNEFEVFCSLLDTDMCLTVRRVGFCHVCRLTSIAIKVKLKRFALRTYKEGVCSDCAANCNQCICNVDCLQRFKVDA